MGRGAEAEEGGDGAVDEDEEEEEKEEEEEEKEEEEEEEAWRRTSMRCLMCLSDAVKRLLVTYEYIHI